jgi:hypothetical protein
MTVKRLETNAIGIEAVCIWMDEKCGVQSETLPLHVLDVCRGD